MCELLHTSLVVQEYSVGDGWPPQTTYALCRMLRRSSAAVATSREGQRSPIAGRGVHGPAPPHTPSISQTANAWLGSKIATGFRRLSRAKVATRAACVMGVPSGFAAFTAGTVDGNSQRLCGMYRRGPGRYSD